VALVGVGLILSFFGNFLNFEISSELILDILVPPLIFEATLHVKQERLRYDIVPILLLALVGTLVGTAIVGGIIFQFLGIPLVAAVAFGALISATDPVAVVAFFRSLGVSKRLAMLVEGESLFNDGVAIVIFSLAVALGSEAGALESFSVWESIITFFQVAVGGLVIGGVLGYFVSSFILKNVDDHLIETATSVALAFGSFVVAEELHLSGILAVVAAGYFVGNIGLLNTSPTTKITLNNFWEFLAFLVNSVVFLAIGLKIEIRNLAVSDILPILVALIAVLLSRALLIYCISWFYGLLRPHKRISVPYQHIMFWGGLRGAISLALVLTITPTTFSAFGNGAQIANQLEVMTFGVVLFTLLVQGLTIERLIKWLGLSQKPKHKLEQERRQALVYAKRAGKAELERLHRNGIVGTDLWQALSVVYDEEIEQSRIGLREYLSEYPETEQQMMLKVRADLVKAERGAIIDALGREIISEEVYEELVRETDARREALAIIESQWETSKDVEVTHG
jgi:CPA1 family monovalent cation:H+ antiporter